MRIAEYEPGRLWHQGDAAPWSGREVAELVWSISRLGGWPENGWSAYQEWVDRTWNGWQMPTPLFDRLISGCTEPQLALALIGRSLLRDVRTRSGLVFIKGDTDSGKSVLLKVVERLTGGQVGTARCPAELGGRFDLYGRAYGKSLLMIPDLAETNTGHFDHAAGAATLKLLSGGDTLQMEIKGDPDLRSFKPRLTVLVATNVKAAWMSSDDHASWSSRILPLRMPNTVAKRDQITDLDMRIVAGEGKAVACKAVVAYVSWARSGALLSDDALRTVDAMIRAGMIWQIRFAADRLALGKGRVTYTALCSEYTAGLSRPGSSVHPAIRRRAQRRGQGGLICASGS